MSSFSTPSRPNTNSRSHSRSDSNGNNGSNMSPSPSLNSASGFTPGGAVPVGYSYLGRSPSLVTPTRKGEHGKAGRNHALPRVPVSHSQRANINMTSSSAGAGAGAGLTRSKTVPSITTTTTSGTPSHLRATRPNRSSLQAHRTSAFYDPALLTTTTPLPYDPKTWTASQVSVYLSHILHLVPEPVMETLHDFVRRENLSGKAFLRLKEEDLESKGINFKWRKLMSEASRRLRRDALRRKIWTNNETSWDAVEDNQPQEQELTPSQRRIMTATLKRIRDKKQVKGLIAALESPSGGQDDLHLAESPSPPGKLSQLRLSPSNESLHNKRSITPPFGSGFVRRQASSFDDLASVAQEHEGSSRRARDRSDETLSSSGSTASDVDEELMTPSDELVEMHFNLSDNKSSYDETTDDESTDTDGWKPLSQDLVDAILANTDDIPTLRIKTSLPSSEDTSLASEFKAPHVSSIFSSPAPAAPHHQARTLSRANTRGKREMLAVAALATESGSEATALMLNKGTRSKKGGKELLALFESAARGDHIEENVAEPVAEPAEHPHKGSKGVVEPVAKPAEHSEARAEHLTTEAEEVIAPVAQVAEHPEQEAEEVYLPTQALEIDTSEEVPSSTSDDHQVDETVVPEEEAADDKEEEVARPDSMTSLTGKEGDEEVAADAKSEIVHIELDEPISKGEEAVDEPSSKGEEAVDEPSSQGEEEAADETSEPAPMISTTVEADDDVADLESATTEANLPEATNDTASGQVHLAVDVYTSSSTSPQLRKQRSYLSISRRQAQELLTEIEGHNLLSPPADEVDVDAALDLASDEGRQPEVPLEGKPSWWVSKTSSISMSSIPCYLLGLGAGVAFVVVSEVLMKGGHSR
ncbi:unnamed protein product [Sympodiomycopsis kandeliae]